MSLAPSPPWFLEPDPQAEAENSATPPADRGSEMLGWFALILVFIVGLPIFLCMPQCFDIFHYDICARNLLNGGIHYRDTFDNNLPGILWLQASVRWLVGWGSVRIHAVDLAFFSVGVVLLLRWVRPGVRIWTATALYAFYLFIPEPCPMQRDMWMLLPALVGLTLRRRQVDRLLGPPGWGLSVMGPAILEGLCWGAAVWIKPFAFAPALACWLASVFQVRAARAGRPLRMTADAAGLLAGGLLAGGLGILWLWRSGSWPYFWEIMVDWNRDYGAFAHKGEVRTNTLFMFLLLFLPWSLVPCVAVWLSVKALRSELTGGATRPGFALLAAFFLGWLFQGVCLQLPHQYVLSPAVIPGIVLVAGLYRWRPPSRAGAMLRLTSVALMAFLWVLAFQLQRVALWPRCIREGSTPAVRGLLYMRKESPYAVDSAALDGVEKYLAAQGVGDGDVLCMSGATHALYLDMNLKPPTRFPQIEMTALFFTRHREQLLAEMNAAHPRYIVSDLLWTGLTRQGAAEINPDDPQALPSEFPEEFIGVYPWNERIVFRSGQYLVHRVTRPATKFWREEQPGDGKIWYKNPNDYLQLFEGKMSFRDEAAARESLAVIDDLYRESERTGDEAGRHQALLKALSMADQAGCVGKEQEAEVFRRWLRQKLGEGQEKRAENP